MKENVSFSGLDLGTPKPTSVPMETVQVVVTTERMLDGYAKAFVNEAFRVNPLKAEQVSLTVEEMNEYCEFLLDQRVAQVNHEEVGWYKLKVLYIPVWIQYVLSMVGEVRIREYGLTMMPVREKHSKMTFEEALKVSEKIGSFEDDLNVVQDAMPRSTEGDKDTMSSALFAGYVLSMHPVTHVISTYAAAFLGLKLKEEMAFKVLYRVQYDDLEFIASALLTEKKLY